MKSTLKDIIAHFDFDRMQQTAYSLNELEKSSCYDDFARSAEFCAGQLRDAGFTDVQLISHPADGKSTAFDCTMPQAWSLDRSRRSFLEVCGDKLPACGRILADSTINPLHANLWSAPTPDGGITAPVVDFDTLQGDFSAAKGKWVLYTPCEPGAHFIGGLYHALAEAGIAGLVACNMINADTMPNDLEWYNGNGINGWYLIDGEKRFPTFSITPLAAKALRKLMLEREVTLHGELYCQNYDGEINTVTAVIPGQSRDEIALIAHLYEPFVNDDACGFAHLCEFGRQLIERKVKLQKTLRVIFSMELYGTAAYLKDHGKNIVLAANFDGVPAVEKSDIIIRQLPFFQAGFTDFFNPDLLKKRLPQVKQTLECGNLSDDTFCNDPDFGNGGIPTFWLHTPYLKSHHNTGHLFCPDWRECQKQLPVFDELLENLLCLEKLPDYSLRAAKAFTADAGNILKNPALSAAEKRIYIQVGYIRNTNRLRSVTGFTGQAVDFSALEAAHQKYAALAAELPDAEYSGTEYHALNLIVTKGGRGFPFSLSPLPPSERKLLHFSQLLWSIFDGKRSLWECIRMADAERGVRTDDAQIAAIIADLKLVAKYGYATLRPAVTLDAADFAAALQQLGVTKGMKLAVHSTFSSLGQVSGGAEKCCELLQQAVGETGTLMMPAFTFQVYLDGKKDAVYDVRHTPGKVGILTEKFRQMPGVYRSFDPCHSFAVWGKDAKKYISQHHLYPTIDPEHSPLGLLYQDGGYVLTISSADSVTFMHLVEELNGARCCGKRDEEYQTILPNGQKVKTRAWSWRATTCENCPANKTAEIFDLIRQQGELREVKLNNATLKLFAMEAYRQAYGKLMKKYCRNAAKPRKVECSVRSDWDEKKRRLKKTDAYTGPWLTDKD
ncbi:MAG: DUF4910 domain-containing protein [Lentisphaerae bacterium]|nr:DUF4910 domain-containing protein [Lentisphaerota bacterium]